MLCMIEQTTEPSQSQVCPGYKPIGQKYLQPKPEKVQTHHITPANGAQPSTL